MKSKITVNINKKNGVVNPNIYGQFMEHLGGVVYDGMWVGKSKDNEEGFRKELIEKLRHIKCPVIRWPGGCFAETYSWKDGIGKNRPVRPNFWKCRGDKDETNEVGTHEFVRFCELCGSEAYFAVNITSETPMNARHWVDYCNSPATTTSLSIERKENGSEKPFAVKYWGLGNENWVGGGNMRPEYYADLYRNYSVITYNVDHSISLVACGADKADYNWTEKVMASLSKSEKHIEGYSIHFYCADEGANTTLRFTDNEWYQQMNQAALIEPVLNRHWDIIRGYGMDKYLKLVIDEWGCWHSELSPLCEEHLLEQQSTMREAVVSALTLNIFNNNCDKIMMANVAQTINCLHSLFLSSGDKMVVTPVYYVFDMYKEHQGGELIDISTDNNKKLSFTDRQGDECFVDMLSMSATLKKNRVHITVANLSVDEEAAIDLELYKGSITGNIEMTILKADDIHDCNTYENPDKVKSAGVTVGSEKNIVIPPASVAAISFEAR